MVFKGHLQALLARECRPARSPPSPPHRFQLVYACGSSRQLPALTERVAAVQALLAALHRLAPAMCSPGGALGPRAVVLERGQGAEGKPGGWCGLRLLPGPALGERAVGQLRRKVAEELFRSPTHELQWLKDHPSKVRRPLMA